MNPLNGKSFSNHYLSIKKKIDDLPANNPALKAELFKKLEKVPLIILSGDTGSGKSTQTGKHLLEFFDYKKKVIITQPRTLNASSIATRVAEELDVHVGEEVGFQYKNNRRVSAKTLLTFETDGLTMNKIFNAEDPDELFDGLIIDEAHERNTYIDFLLMYIRDYLKKHPKTDKRFIIMSATLEMAKFEKYFKGIKYDVHSIPGRTFPVDRIYLKNPVADYKPEIYRIISDIIQKKLVGDILVFLISKSEIDDVYNKLQTMNLDKTAIYKMFRGVSEKEKMLAIDSELYKKTTGHPTRKIVLTTNIGETGVTINGIKFVIDNGYNFAMSYDPKLRRNILLNERITKASAKQRAGRAGRTAPGTCYHLMTEAEFNKLPDAKPADIFVTNLEVLFLSLLSNKNFKLKDTKDLEKLLDNLIEPPTKESFNSTLLALYKFGILEKSGSTYKLTKLGNCVSGLQLDIELSVVLLVAKMIGVESEVLKIISLMSIQPQLNKYFMKPDRNFDFDNAKKRKAYFKKLDRLQKIKEDKFASYQSELFSFYHIYQDGKEKDFSSRWFSYYLINPDIFRNLNKTYSDFTNKIAEIDKECMTLLKDSLMSSQIIKDYYYERSEALKKFNQGRVERLTNFNQILNAPLTTKMMICFIFAYQDNIVNVGKTTNDTIEIIMDKDNTFTMRRSPFLQRIGKQILYTDITVIDDAPTLVGLTNL